MSEPITALQGAEFETGISVVSELPLRGMITLRGDFETGMFKKALKASVGLAVPDPRCVLGSDAAALAWMSPDELLVLCPYGDVSRVLEALSTALAGTHALAANVSDARSLFQIKGQHARDIMAKLCPVDLAPVAFGPGAFRRTRLAQVPAAFWMPAEGVFHVICFRSQAEYVFKTLSRAAMPGSEVN